MINNNKINLFEDSQPQPQPKPLPSNQHIQAQPQQDQPNTTFSDYPLTTPIIEALQRMGYTSPTKIQAQSLHKSLSPGDLLCLSETGSGKTLSFILPILQYILQNYQSSVPQGIALIMAPTRQLCLQIQEYFTRFNSQGFDSFHSVVLYGGVDCMKQVLELAKKPSIIVGTPGRILYHLQKTKGFHLNNLKFLVLDEADKLLNLDFEKQINQILQIIPKQRNAYLYSATLTSKVEKLQRVSLKNPVKIEVNPKYHTVSKLQEFYIFIPSKWKDTYLIYLLTKYKHQKTIIFTKTCLGAERLCLVLKELKMNAQCIHGDFSQTQRERALLSFKNNKCSILVCTDLAARGIDIAQIKIVINFDLCPPKQYVHRVGRTARIGRQGLAISLVTQYDVETFQNIENKLGKKMNELAVIEKQALVFLQKLELCHQQVSRKMKRNKGKRFDN